MPNGATAPLPAATATTVVAPAAPRPVEGHGMRQPPVEVGSTLALQFSPVPDAERCLRARIQQDRRRRRMVRVVVTEDRGMVLGALATLLDLKPDIHVAGRAPDSRATWSSAQRERPEVPLPDTSRCPVLPAWSWQRASRPGG